MKLVMISDTHFGDPTCTLYNRDKNGEVVEGLKYRSFKEAAGQNNDYLVLIGDIIDLSVTGYEDAFKIAKAFFLQVQKDKIADEIIYIPGNHDFDIWHTVEYQVNIFHQIQKERQPTHFRWSVPGIIDDRTKSPNRGFTIPGVSRRQDATGHRYGGLFLDKITKPEGEETNFNFVYPNLYLVTDKESVVITHGHYLEAYWVLAMEWVMKIASGDLNIDHAHNLKEMVAVNFPLCQLASSGVGQAGPLTKLIRQVQDDAMAQKLDKIDTYLERLAKEIEELSHLPFFLGLLRKLCLKKAKKMMLDALRKLPAARYSEDFIYKNEVRKRFWYFYQATMVEINEIDAEYGYDIPLPWYVIYGHTHMPIHWGAKNAPSTPSLGITNMRPVILYNTGGWLTRRDEKNQIEFCGAAVFKYETDRGFKSIPVE